MGDPDRKAGRGQERGGDEDPPWITVQVDSIIRRDDRYLIRIRVRNQGGSTAGSVVVEGMVGTGGGVETSEVTFDYVPAQSERRGGLFFRQDPRARRLVLRPLAYTEP